MKNVKLLLLCFMLFMVKPLLCQYSITAIEPAGLFNFSDLWSFTIVKTTNDNTLEYVVKMDISRQGEGLVISASSAKFYLDAPVVTINQANRNKLEPVALNYFNGFDYSTIMANNSRLPEGTYIIHLTLLECDGPIKQVVAAETDFTLVIDPMAVIFQTSPMDVDTICEDVPMFSWVYSNPLAVDNTVNYKLVMVELSDGQNPYDGVMYNPPYLVEENISSTFFQYPPSVRGLIPGKNYAWQVIAHSYNKPIAYSEVWSFNSCFQKDKTEEKPIFGLAFIDLKPSADGEVMITDNTLRFRFSGRYGTGKLAFKIVDATNKIVATDRDVVLDVKNGDNRFLIDLCGKDGITLKKGVYTLVVTDQKGKEWYMLFNNNPKYTCD